MTIRYLVLSYKLKDATGVVKAFQEYGQFDDSSTTIPQLMADIQESAGFLDALIDAQILGITVKIDVPLPAGAKTVPVANGDVEECAAMTFNLVPTKKYKYTIVIPSVHPAAFNKAKTTSSDAAVVDWWGDFQNNSRHLVFMDDKYTATIGGFKGGRKRFRKARKALKRA